MQVKDLMSTHVICVAPEETVQVAARLLSRHNIGALPVCSSDGRLRGVITDRDIVLRCVAAQEDPAKTLVRNLMTSRVISVSPTDDANTATALMAREQVRRLPVTEQGKVVGILCLSDVATRQDFSTEAAACLGSICSNVSPRE